MERPTSSVQTYTIKKVSRWETYLFTTAFFCILMPVGAQYVSSFLLIVWFVANRAWRFSFGLSGIEKYSDFFSLRRLKAQDSPYYYLITAIFLCAAFTALALSITLVTNLWNIPFGKAAGNGLNLIGKQCVHGLILLIAYLAIYTKGWRLRMGYSYFIALMAITVIYMIIQRYTGIDWIHGFGTFLPANRFSYGVYRASGFMSHPLSLGYNALILTILAYTRLFRSKSLLDKRDELFWYATLVLSACILILSTSRWPISVALIIIMASEIKRIWHYKKTATAMVFMLIAALWLEKSSLGRFEELFHHGQTLEEKVPRLVFWQIHLKMFLDHPIAGVGYAARKVASLDYYDKAGYTNNKQKYSAHNIFLQTKADSGLIGLIGLLALIGGVFITGSKLRKKYQDDGLIFVALTAILSGLMQNTYRDSEYLFCFWVCVAFLLTQATPEIKLLIQEAPSASSRINKNH